jgi:CubicO group peptidase (beta-lactamase class C family)
MRKLLPSLITLVFIFSSCHLGRFFVYNFANITDHKIFPYTEIGTGDDIYRFPVSERDPLGSMTLRPKKGKMSLTEWLDDETSTVSFLVIQHDSIVYEQYFEGYEPGDIATIFSVSKSVTSLLTGIAVDEGLIEDINDPVTKYIPELLEGDPRFQRLTIRHLLDMRSGLDYKESYTNPFADMAKLYYGTNQLKQLSKLGFNHEPGTYFEYQSGTTGILGIAVERATGMDLGQYLEAKVWKPMGMEFPASWSLDDKRHRSAKGYSGLNTTARDLAKIGQLYLNGGRWRGQQIVSEAWIKASATPDLGNDGYQYQWYSMDESLANEDRKTRYFPDSLAAASVADTLSADYVQVNPSQAKPGQWYINYAGDEFYAQGILNQLIYVDPDKDLIIVRQGRKWDGGYLWLFSEVGEALR